MSRNINCTYVSEKVSKIRWRPNPLGEPYSFVTGSWDNDINNIRLWEVRTKIIEEETDINTIEVKDLPFVGDVTELKFVNADRLIASSSEGSLYLLKLLVSETGEIDICEDISWRNLHYIAPDFSTSCTSFATYDIDIASVGEDGKISLLTMTHKEPKSMIKNADSCTINCVEFLKYNELLTSNIRGQMKIWDLRTPTNTEESMFMLSNDDIVAATCLAYHPTQRHIIASGDEQGTLTVWDLRQNNFPLNVITSHTDAISELHFHPDKPDQIFTCSEAGDVFHWTGLKQGGLGGDTQPWFTTTATTNKYDIFRLMPQLHVPVNTLDLNRDKLLCGCDNEAIYLIEEVNIYG